MICCQVIARMDILTLTLDQTGRSERQVKQLVQWLKPYLLLDWLVMYPSRVTVPEPNSPEVLKTGASSATCIRRGLSCQELIKRNTKSNLG
jgi:hypothetical protein